VTRPSDGALAAGAARDELAAAAVVGVERRPYGAHHLPVVADLGLARPEERVLAAAAVLSGYERAGRRPGRLARRPHGAPPEVLPPAPPEATELLDLLLGGQVGLAGGEGELLAHWLATCAAAGRRVPPRQLVAVLDAAARRPALRAAATVAAGERGRWLAGHNTRWAWARRPDGAPQGTRPGGPSTTSPAAAALPPLGDETATSSGVALQHLLERTPGPWPEAWSLDAVAAVRAACARARARPEAWALVRQLAPVLVEHLHLGAAPALEAWAGAPATDEQLRRAVTGVWHAVALRHTIDEAFA
jgi:hypothetical protein